MANISNDYYNTIPISEEKSMEQIVYCQRYNPRTLLDKKVWGKYMEMRDQFQIGEYVLFNEDGLIAKSDKGFENNYTMKRSDSSKDIWKTQFIFNVLPNDYEFSGCLKRWLINMFYQNIIQVSA